MQAQLPPVSFQYLKRDKDLYSSSFQSLTEDRYGFIWFGSKGGGGLYRYDGYQLRSFLPDPSHLESTITSALITTINSVTDSTIFIGTSFGFTLLNPISGRVRNYNNKLEKLPDSRIGVTWAFLDDTMRNVYWIGTRYGLSKFDPSDDASFMNLRPDKPIDGVFFPDDVVRILIDQTDPDILWLASFSGLFSYSVSGDSFTHYVCPEIQNPKMRVADLQQQPSGYLWLATREGFVLSYHIESKQWKLYPIPPSDPSPDAPKDVYKIMPVNDTLMWVSTYSSVGQLNTRSGKFVAWSYDADLPDGLLPNRSYLDIINDRHGRLWVGSWHGVQIARQTFLPRSTSVTNLKVAVTAVEVSPVLTEDVKALLYSGTLNLTRDQRDVTFQFVLPNPLNPSAVSYQYMLKGYDSDWIITDQRKVRYARLKGGKYTFIIKGREGATNEWLPPTELNVVIPKRISEFWWFWSIIIGLVFIVAILVYRFLISKVRKEERLKSEFEHKLSEIQMQALRAQMNPHFLFNSLNSIKYYAISKSKDETAAYLSKFALLVRAILNNSKSDTISLKDELDALQLYIEIEHLRLEGKFDYLIDIDSSIHVGRAQIPPMILQPYVENAIWHGLMHKEGKGRLLVQVKDMGDQVQCIIEDNGIGRERAAEIRKARMEHKSSVGMEITGNRIELINRIYGIDTQVHVIDLVDESGVPAGTRVVINIPLIRDEEEE